MSRRYPRAPVAAVGAVISDGERMVLVRRANPPSSGKWGLPGGAVELGETAEQAVRREVSEECGLDVEVGPVLCVVDIIDRDDGGAVRYHYLVADYRARVTGGELLAGSDVDGVVWVTPAGALELDLTPGARRLVIEMGERMVATW